MVGRRRLDRRTALVTGGNTGIGAGIARAFAAEGAQVAIAYLRERDQAESMAEELGGLAVPCDVTDENQVRMMIEQVVDRWGRLDILVNNAGVISFTPVAEMSVAEWDRTIAVHLRGTFLCCHYALPHMQKQGYGKIINIASQVGQVGRPCLAHYGAAKAGVIGFTKSLAREVARQGIWVNAIAPGPVETGLVKRTPEELAWWAERLPLGRIGTVDEITPTALFLASDDSSYYVGQTLGPNGGDVML